MERELRIYERREVANPTSLAHSRLLNDRFLPEYATTVRRAISLKAGRHSNDDLWSFVMLPDALVVSRLSSFPHSPKTHRYDFDNRFLAQGDRGCLAVRPAHAPSLSSRPRRVAMRAGAGHAQEGEEDPAVGAPGATERGVPATRASGTLSPSDLGEFVIGGGGGGRERRGAGSPQEVESPTPSPRVAEVAVEQVSASAAEVLASDRCRDNGSRTIEEKEAGLLQFEVGGILTRRPRFRGVGA
jgi:hypothetical protein